MTSKSYQIKYDPIDETIPVEVLLKRKLVKLEHNWCLKCVQVSNSGAMSSGRNSNEYSFESLKQVIYSKVLIVYHQSKYETSTKMFK